jgi:hemolysin-activating ACP:hemolysin acyltransferase
MDQETANVQTDGIGQNAYRVLQDKNPFAACGRTIAYLMNVANFARMPFGNLSKLIVGQINRRHYFFMVDHAQQICGYCGWTQATHEQAERWLLDNVDITTENQMDGPVCVINIWQASTPHVNSAIVSALRQSINPASQLIVAKRFYRDGSIRPMRLPLLRVR